MKIKFIICILIVVCIAFCLSIKAQAYSIENIFSDAQNFLQAGNSVDETINKAALKDTSNFIYKLLLAIGVIVAFIVGVVLGIQFMVSSAEDKAKVKEALVAYTISCIVLFGAYGIWSLVVGMAQDMTTPPHAHDWEHCYGQDGDCQTSWFECNKCGMKVYMCENRNDLCDLTGSGCLWRTSFEGENNDVYLECHYCHRKRSSS